MNSVNVVGRLVADPEMVETAGGTLCKMRVAVDRAGSKQEDGTISSGFFDVAAWDKLAETCGQYLAKGRQAAFTGALRFEEWQDKDTGGKRSKVSITAFAMTFVGAKPDGEGEGAAPANADDDIPF